MFIEFMALAREKTQSSNFFSRLENPLQWTLFSGINYNLVSSVQKKNAQV
jgi:thiamine monophosphate kinase